MPCPHCVATPATAQSRRTALGYRTFRCCACLRVCNERRGTPFKHRHYPTDLVLLVVLWRRRYTLRLRDGCVRTQTPTVQIAGEGGQSGDPGQ